MEIGYHDDNHDVVTMGDCGGKNGSQSEHGLLAANQEWPCKEGWHGSPANMAKTKKPKKKQPPKYTWTADQENELIDLYEEHEHMYNKDLVGYRNRDRKEATYEKFSKKLNLPGEFLFIAQSVPGTYCGKWVCLYVLSCKGWLVKSSITV